MISTLLFAVYGVMGKRRCARFGGVVVTCASFLCGGAEMLFMILFSRLPMVNKWLAGSGLELFANIPLLSGYSWNTLPWMLMICIVNTGLGFACYFKRWKKPAPRRLPWCFLKAGFSACICIFYFGRGDLLEYGARNRFHPNWLAISTAARSAGGAKTSENAWGINQKKPFQFN